MWCSVKAARLSKNNGRKGPQCEKEDKRKTSFFHLAFPLSLNVRSPTVHYHQARPQMTSTPRLRGPPSQPPEAQKGRGMKPISDTASRAGKAERSVLLSFDEMSEWFRREFNQWILHDYRPISGSTRAFFCSWSYIHNESVNIYSHLIPTVFFLLDEWYIQQYLVSRYFEITDADFIAFFIFMFAAVVCLSLSATYHTLLNHSQHVKQFCLRLNMLNVVIFILGDLILRIYIIFWCETLLRNTYWSMISEFLCVRF